MLEDSIKKIVKENQHKEKQIQELKDTHGKKYADLSKLQNSLNEIRKEKLVISENLSMKTSQLVDLQNQLNQISTENESLTKCNEELRKSNVLLNNQESSNVSKIITLKFIFVKLINIPGHSNSE